MKSKKVGITLALFGLLVQLAGQFVWNEDGILQLTGIFISAAGIGFFAASKKRSILWSLTGLFPFVGPIFGLFLKEREPFKSKATDSLRCMGFFLIPFGLLVAFAFMPGAGYSGAGIVGLGISFYLASVAAEKGWKYYPLILLAGFAGMIAMARFQPSYYGDMLRKAKEGSTKSSLTSLRTAISFYKGEHHSKPPKNLEELIPNYIESIPTAKLGAHHEDSAGAQSNANQAFSDENGWMYQARDGLVYVNCTHTDTRGVAISSW